MSATTNEGVNIWRCVTCGLGVFPQPMLCPRCHSPDFAMARVTEAVVEEVSVIRHMLGQENWQPRRIASVRTAEGLLMTVGLADESGPGATIALYQDGEAPFGRCKA